MSRLRAPPRGARSRSRGRPAGLGGALGGAAESLRAARGVARIAGAPRAGGARIYDTVRRAALTVGDDLLRPAPASYLNVPDRAPARAAAPRAPHGRPARREARGRRDAQRRVPGGGRPGALRETALARGESPRALKAMVPVVGAVRGGARRSRQPHLAGVHRPSACTSSTPRLAAGGGPPRHVGVQALRSARGSRGHLRRAGHAARRRCAPARRGWSGSKRVYNLTVSNIPGPALPALRARRGAARGLPRGADRGGSRPVDRHVHATGDHMHFGLYADPEALPDVRGLPDALNAAIAGA